MLSGSGASAYETGTQSFNSNALRSYNHDGKRHRKPSDTSAMRADMVVMLMNAFPHIRRVKKHDSGIEFQARVRLQGGGISIALPITFRTFTGSCLTASLNAIFLLSSTTENPFTGCLIEGGLSFCMLQSAATFVKKIV